MSPDLIADLADMGLFILALGVIYGGMELVLRRTHLTDEGASLDRLLAGPQRREYRDAP